MSCGNIVASVADVALAGTRRSARLTVRSTRCTAHNNTQDLRGDRFSGTTIDYKRLMLLNVMSIVK